MPVRKPQPGVRFRVNRVIAGVLALLLALIALGCSGDQGRNGSPDASGAGTPQAPSIRGDAKASRVVRGWADALRSGDVEAAARFFALPSRVSNGGGLLKLTTIDEVRAFNQSLPCGARLIATEPAAQGRIIASFGLTERPGPGTCGVAPASTARTAFLVRDGQITEWIRVEDLTAVAGTEA